VVGYFFEQVLAAYSLLSGLQEGFSKFNVVFAASFLTFSWLIFITCDTAQRATDEVRRFWTASVLRIWRSGLDSLGGERGHSAS
jgi:hypothetical protein